MLTKTMDRCCPKSCAKLIERQQHVKTMPWIVDFRWAHYIGNRVPFGMHEQSDWEDCSCPPICPAPKEPVYHMCVYRGDYQTVLLDFLKGKNSGLPR